MDGEKISQVFVLLFLGGYLWLAAIILIRVVLVAVMRTDIHDIERKGWWPKVNYGCAMAVIIAVVCAICLRP